MQYETQDGKPRQVLFSVEQTASMLGIGRTKVFELLASDTLGSVTIGSRRLVPLTEIEALVQRLMGKTEPRANLDSEDRDDKMPKADKEPRGAGT